MLEIAIKTSKRNDAIDITEKIQQVIQKQNFEKGACLIFCPHTSAAVIVNENYDPAVAEDILSKLSKIVPKNAAYSHTEGNADAHIKTALVGNSVIVPVENKRLALGQWQGILFFEFDGPRKRSIWAGLIK